MRRATAESTRSRIARTVRANAYLYLTHEDARALFGFGEKSFRALIALGAPTVADKVLPDHLRQWLWENRDKIGKLTTAADE